MPPNPNNEPNEYGADEVLNMMDAIFRQQVEQYERIMKRIDDLSDKIDKIADEREEAKDTRTDNELYEEAKEAVIEAQKASTSFLQRKLHIGYAMAARLIDKLEEEGIVEPGSGAKPRKVLIIPKEDLE